MRSKRPLAIYIACAFGIACALRSPNSFASNVVAHTTTPEEPSSRVKQATAWLPRLGARWGNDQLYIENGDDVGFTQDFLLEGHLLDNHNDISLRAHHRLIVQRFGPWRTDEFSWRLRWLREYTVGRLSFTVGPAASLALSGNFGGASMQQAWHRTLANGYTFGHGLPQQYDGYRAGFVAAALAGVSWLPQPWLRLLVGSEVGGALGRTGKSEVIFYDAVELESSPSGFRLAVALGVDFERRWTKDPALTLPGGYQTREFSRNTHVRVAARGDSWEVGYEALSNIGGAETHFGNLYLLWGGGSYFRHHHALR